MDKELLGQRLKWLRKSHFLTLEDFAGKCGVDKSYISRLERGLAKNPSAALVSRVCATFNVTDGWLLEGEGYPSMKQIDKVIGQRFDFPVLSGLTNAQVYEAMEHFKAQAKDKPKWLRALYIELFQRIFSEHLERLKEPPD